MLRRSLVHVRWRLRRNFSVSAPFGIYFAVLSLAVSPLLWVAVPPLIDFPDHLARMAVLLNRDPTAAIAANYVADWRILPNLAMDIVVPNLARVMPLEVAGRVFLAVIMIMLVLGAALLHRVLHGRLGLWPLCTVLFLYNDALFGGLVNYLFGLAVALLSFSLWIVSEKWARSVRLSLFTIMTTVIFLLHLFAFGLFGLLVVSYEAGGEWTARSFDIGSFRRRAAALVIFIPAGLLWLVSLPNMGDPLFTAQGDVHRKIEVWLDAVSFNYPRAPLDDLILMVIAAFLVFGCWTRRLSLAPAMRLPIAAAVVAAVIMPEWLSGAWGADLRLPVALLFIVVAATRLNAASARLPIMMFAVAAGLLFGARITAVALGWRVMDRQFAEFRQAIRPLPTGVRIMTVQSPWPREAHKLAGVPEALQFRPRAAYWHLDTLAVIDRGAFVTDLFTFDAPISVSRRNAGLGRDHWQPSSPEQLLAWASLERPKLATPGSIEKSGKYVPCCYGWPKTYDFVLWIDFGRPPSRLPPFLRPWGQGSYFHIYRVVRP